MIEGNFNIRGDISSLKKQSEENQQKEILSDSDHDFDLGWSFYDSPLQDYEINFKDTLPENVKSIDEYIRLTYKDKNKDLVGIELGGPGNNLFSGLARGYFKKTAGFTLHKSINKAADDQIPLHKHDIIEADVFNKRKPTDTLGGYQKIENWIKDNGKADIIIERMVAPINSPYSDHLLMIIKRWYKLLNSNGTLFLSLPRNYDYSDDIAEFLSQHRDLFEYKMVKTEFGDLAKGELAGTYIRLKKLENAPDSLDVLLASHNEVDLEHENLDREANHGA